MTQSLIELATPFLLRLFTQYGIPEVHMFSNAKDRIVYAYTQSVSEQMAVTDGHIVGDPQRVHWNYTSIVITDTTRWNIDSAVRVISHMTKDGTGKAFVVLQNSDCEAYKYLRHYCIDGPIVIRPVQIETYLECNLPVIMIVSTRRSKAKATIVLSSVQLGDVRDMFRLPRSRNIRENRTLVLELMETHSGLPNAEFEWWKQFKSQWPDHGCGERSSHPWQYSPLDNMRFMRPKWMRGWYYDKEDLPALDDIRCPGNERTLSALPLPDPPNDEHSKLVWKEAIEPNKEIFKISTPLNVEKLEELLVGFPNYSHKCSWIKALTEGLWPWMNSFPNDPPEGVVFPNSKGMEKYKGFINSVRTKEVSFGHWRELKVLPKYFRNSPISVVPKPEGGNRLIQNLSFPKGNSVNDQIPLKEGKVCYDEIGALAKVIVVLHSQGKKDWVPWKLDVSRAFRNIPLHPLCALRNGVMLKARRGKSIFFIDSQACFGGRAFPRAYCSAEDLVGWIATKTKGVNILLRFVDDHFGVSPIEQGAQEPKDMELLRDVFKSLSIPTNDKYDSGEDIVIIGKEVNYAKATIQLSKEKLIKYLSMCQYFLRRETMTLTEIDHVCGVLDYCLDIVPTGKVFNNIFYALKSEHFGKDRKHFITIDNEVRESLRWWSFALSSRPVRWLLKEFWWSSNDASEIIFTDASTSGGLGIYRPLQKKAYIHCYNTQDEIYSILNGPRKDALVHINTMELLAIVSAIQIIGAECAMRNESNKKRIVVMCDNSSACDAIRKLKSGDYIMKQLLKDLTEELQFIDLRVCHISGEFNPADWLTRAEKSVNFAQHFSVKAIYRFQPPSLDRYLTGAKQNN